MWSIAVVIVAAGLILLGWWRSGQTFRDFLLLRASLAYARIWHRWTGPRPAHWPGDGPCLVIANHTCSADPAFLLAASTRGISFLVAAEHYDVHPAIRLILDHLDCVRVRRDGRDWLAIRRALRRLENGLAVCLFPEGNLSGVPSGRLLRAKQGIAYLALKTRVPVYPAYIAGGPRTEELLNSWVLPTRRAVRVTFGAAIDLSEYRDRRITRSLIAEVTEHLMQAVEALG
ncbi:MAG: 1-acyl-sn-glycerol-3-phosphate acyltransferase [Planctomycetes bacterium]|nr:1-acyl-sn-glycerol-3-phosphate acyltransferase [Planctomycetota bacterium]